MPFSPEMVPNFQKPPATADERQALDDLFSLIYEELRRLASFVRQNEANVTINSTALVHEAWLKLKDSPQLALKPLSHFRSIAVKAMRQVLVDEARRRQSKKRSGSADPLSLKVVGEANDMLSDTADLLILDSALEELAQCNARQAQVIESRFFGGLTVAETAALLGVSDSAVERDWRVAKAWLATKLGHANESSGHG